MFLIFVCNVFIGIIVKGVVDDFDLVLKILEKVGYIEDWFYIYVDGVLFGFMMFFVRRVCIIWGIIIDKF